MTSLLKTYGAKEAVEASEFSKEILELLDKYRSSPRSRTPSEAKQASTTEPATGRQPVTRVDGHNSPRAGLLTSNTAAIQTSPTRVRKFSSFDDLIRIAGGPPPPEALIECGGAWDAFGFAKKFQMQPSRDAFVLVVQNYTSVITAGEEQQLFILLQSKAIPPEPLFAKIGSDSIRLRLYGNALLATVPPQEIGDRFLTVTSGEDMTPVAFQMSHQESSKGPYLAALPFNVIRAPLVRSQPRLAYSTNKGTRPFPRGFKQKMPIRRSGYCTPYNEKELKTFLAACERFKHNVISVPEVGPRKVKKGGTTKESDQERLTDLKKRLKALKGYRKPEQLDGAKVLLGLVDPTLLDSVIPFSLRASVWMSCPPLIRKAIDKFHLNAFELQPFDVCSAHIFVKTHPDDLLTVFAFGLTSCRDSEQEAPVPLRYTSSLDRFEVPERHCTDPRYWKFIDSVVPSKNTFTANTDCMEILRHDQIAFPVPPPLLKSRIRLSGMGSDPSASSIELAPLVFLHIEQWPKKILHLQEHSESKTTVRLSAKTTTEKSEKTKPTESKEEPEKVLPSSAAPSESKYFGVTLCVGKYIYTSVTGVSEWLVNFILDDWLKWVPSRESVQRASHSESTKLQLTFPALANV